MGTTMKRVVSGGGVEVTFTAQTGNYGRVDMLVRSADYPKPATIQLNRDEIRDIRDMLDKILGE